MTSILEVAVDVTALLWEGLSADAVAVGTAVEMVMESVDAPSVPPWSEEVNGKVEDVASEALGAAIDVSVPDCGVPVVSGASKVGDTPDMPL